MNAVLSRLDALGEEISLDRFDLGESPSCVILTPRFRASRHVVALLIPNGEVEPTVVVKMPRLSGDDEGIAREARVLTSLRQRCPDADGSVPEVVACADGDRPVLIETALRGRLMTPAMVRANLTRCIDDVVSWLMCLPRDKNTDGSFGRLIAEPLARFSESFPAGAREHELVARTLDVVEPLRDASVPRVFEHGDLSHPNLILRPSAGIGVVDWELAEEDGFPLHDLAFFLTFATFAVRRSPARVGYVDAFGDAFFARSGWARSRVIAYADGLQLNRGLLTPLFVACWARYTAGLAIRIADDRAGLDEGGAAWVRENRYYRLWSHTLENLEDLNWER
jgi:aminoglycoside phosphotransferase (APT) family kinase protein